MSDTHGHDPLLGFEEMAPGSETPGEAGVAEGIRNYLIGLGLAVLLTVTSSISPAPISSGRRAYRSR